MPMVVYTEEEVIEKCNEAEALGAERAAADRDRAMADNQRLRAIVDRFWRNSLVIESAVRSAEGAFSVAHTDIVAAVKDAQEYVKDRPFN